MKKTDMILLALSAALAVLLAPAPAEARVTIDKNTVTIQESLGGEWDTALRQSIRFIDPYTRTRMVVGSCRSYAKRCVTVRYGSPDKRAWVGQCGLSCGPSRPVSTIVIRKTWAGSGPVAAKKRLLTHELAHAFGLGHSGFTSVMYPFVYRNWQMSPYKFTAGQKTILRRG